MVCPMSMGGGALRPPTERRRHSYPCIPRTPRSSPCSTPDSGKNAKKAAPSPRFAGPAPAATTENPDASGQYPAGSRSEDDPCLGLRALRTGGACGSSINTASVRQGQYPCQGSARIFLSFRDLKVGNTCLRTARDPGSPQTGSVGQPGSFGAFRTPGGGGRAHRCRWVHPFRSRRGPRPTRCGRNRLFPGRARKQDCRSAPSRSPRGRPGSFPTASR